MEPPIRIPFTSWDGLEEEELGDLKSAIRDITNAKSDIAQKQSLKRPAKKEQKKLQDEISKLITLTRAWARRPRPTSNQQPSLEARDRVKFRKIYVLIQEGLQNPIRASDEDFVNQLRDLCQIGEEIGATDAYEVEDASETGENKDSLGIETVFMTDEEKIMEAASRVTFSPPPNFSDIEERLENQPFAEGVLEFEIDQAIRDEFQWVSVNEKKAKGKEASEKSSEIDESSEEEEEYEEEYENEDEEKYEDEEEYEEEYEEKYENEDEEKYEDEEEDEEEEEEVEEEVEEEYEEKYEDEDEKKYEDEEEEEEEEEEPNLFVK